MSDEEVNEFIKNTFAFNALNIVSRSVGMSTFISYKISNKISKWILKYLTWLAIIN